MHVKKEENVGIFDVFVGASIYALYQSCDFKSFETFLNVNKIRRFNTILIYPGKNVH